MRWALLVRATPDSRLPLEFGAGTYPFKGGAAAGADADADTDASGD